MTATFRTFVVAGLNLAIYLLSSEAGSAGCYVRGIERAAELDW
jgi:hypothetical protein